MSKHVWQTDEYGRDDFALSYGYHNGPVCTVCNVGFCKWCTPKFDELECDGA